MTAFPGRTRRREATATKAATGAPLLMLLLPGRHPGRVREERRRQQRQQLEAALTKVTLKDLYLSLAPDFVKLSRISRFTLFANFQSCMLFVVDETETGSSNKRAASRFLFYSAQRSD